MWCWILVKVWIECLGSKWVSLKSKFGNNRTINGWVFQKWIGQTSTQRCRPSCIATWLCQRAIGTPYPKCKQAQDPMSQELRGDKLCCVSPNREWQDASSRMWTHPPPLWLASHRMRPQQQSTRIATWPTSPQLVRPFFCRPQACMCYCICVVRFYCDLLMLLSE